MESIAFQAFMNVEMKSEAIAMHISIAQEEFEWDPTHNERKMVIMWS